MNPFALNKPPKRHPSGLQKSSIRQQIKAYLELIKPERTLVNVITAATGFFFAGLNEVSSGVSLELFVWLILGTSLVIASACVANNLLDRKIDQAMSRTKQRALVSGQVDATGASVLMLLLAIVGFGLLALINWLTFGLGVLAYISYVFIYGWAKRHTIWSTLIGTLPGGLSLVAGYSAITNRIDIYAALLFLIMATWQMGHFYAIAVYRKDDYKKAKLPIWSVAKGVASTKQQIIFYEVMFIVSCLILAYLVASWLLGLVAFAAGMYWLYITTTRYKYWAQKSFRASLSVILVVSLAVAVSPLI